MDAQKVNANINAYVFSSAASAALFGKKQDNVTKYAAAESAQLVWNGFQFVPNAKQNSSTAKNSIAKDVVKLPVQQNAFNSKDATNKQLQPTATKYFGLTDIKNLPVMSARQIKPNGKAVGAVHNTNKPVDSNMLALQTKSKIVATNAAQHKDVFVFSSTTLPTETMKRIKTKKENQFGARPVQMASAAQQRSFNGAFGKTMFGINSNENQQLLNTAEENKMKHINTVTVKEEQCTSLSCKNAACKDLATDKLIKKNEVQNAKTKAATASLNTSTTAATVSNTAKIQHLTNTLKNDKLIAAKTGINAQENAPQYQEVDIEKCVQNITAQFGDFMLEDKSIDELESALRVIEKKSCSLFADDEWEILSGTDDETTELSTEMPIKQTETKAKPKSLKTTTSNIVPKGPNVSMPVTKLSIAKSAAAFSTKENKRLTNTFDEFLERDDIYKYMQNIAKERCRINFLLNANQMSELEFASDKQVKQVSKNQLNSQKFQAMDFTQIDDKQSILKFDM